MKFIQLNEKERELLFHTVGDENKVSSTILEKDFWVTWTLRYLFHDFLIEIKLFSNVVHVYQRSMG